MKKADLMKIDIRHFGLPAKRKFPMHTENHLRSAIAYFYTASKEDREELAANIVRRHKALKSKIRISQKNPLYQYVPDYMKKDIPNKDRGKHIVKTETIMNTMPILDDNSKAVIESLLKKTDLTTVDDLDSAVPDDVKNKAKILGFVKSCILNEDIDGKPYDYPLFYKDFIAPKEVLQKNNGGLNSSNFSILKYDGSLNETTSLNPVHNIEHIQFCALLREWYELYENGHRDLTYDRLMIDSWKTRLESAIQDHKDMPTPTKMQRIKDLGIDEQIISRVDDYVDYALFDMDKKIKELELFEPDEDVDADDVESIVKRTDGNTVTISNMVGDDGNMIQKGVMANDEYEKYVWEP